SWQVARFVNHSWSIPRSAVSCRARAYDSADSKRRIKDIITHRSKLGMVGPTRSCCTLQNCGWRFPGAIAGPQQRAKNASRPTLGLAKAISIEVKTGGPGGGHGCRVFHIWAPFDIPAGAP